MAFVFACRPCASSDPTTDTVKVSFEPPPEDKENVAPAHDYEAEKIAKEQAERARAEAQAAAVEAARQAAEAEAQQQAEEAEAERKRAEAEVSALAEAAAREEAEWQQEEQRRLAAQQAAEEAARREADVKAKAQADRKVSQFLKSHGFKSDVNSKKSSMLKSTYPLHVAVKEQDAEMVKLLLFAGADKSLKNSSGYTPVQKAEQYSKQKKGDAKSTGVLSALSC